MVGNHEITSVHVRYLEQYIWYEHVCIMNGKTVFSSSIHVKRMNDSSMKYPLLSLIPMEEPSSLSMAFPTFFKCNNHVSYYHMGAWGRAWEKVTFSYASSSLPINPTWHNIPWKLLKVQVQFSLAWCKHSQAVDALCTCWHTSHCNGWHLPICMVTWMLHNNNINAGYHSYKLHRSKAAAL